MFDSSFNLYVFVASVCLIILILTQFFQISSSDVIIRSIAKVSCIRIASPNDSTIFIVGIMETLITAYFVVTKYQKMIGIRTNVMSNVYFKILVIVMLTIQFLNLKIFELEDLDAFLMLWHQFETIKKTRCITAYLFEYFSISYTN